MKSDSHFRFSHNGHGYDVAWRDSMRPLGAVARSGGGWTAIAPDGKAFVGVFATRGAAAWALFAFADETAPPRPGRRDGDGASVPRERRETMDKVVETSVALYRCNCDSLDPERECFDARWEWDRAMAAYAANPSPPDDIGLMTSAGVVAELEVIAGDLADSRRAGDCTQWHEASEEAERHLRSLAARLAGTGEGWGR